MPHGNERTASAHRATERMGRNSTTTRSAPTRSIKKTLETTGQKRSWRARECDSANATAERSLPIQALDISGSETPGETETTCNNAGDAQDDTFARALTNSNIWSWFARSSIHLYHAVWEPTLITQQCSTARAYGKYPPPMSSTILPLAVQFWLRNYPRWGTKQ